MKDSILDSAVAGRLPPWSWKQDENNSWSELLKRHHLTFFLMALIYFYYYLFIILSIKKKIENTFFSCV